MIRDICEINNDWKTENLKREGMNITEKAKFPYLRIKTLLHTIKILMQEFALHLCFGILCPTCLQMLCNFQSEHGLTQC